MANNDDLDREIAQLTGIDISGVGNPPTSPEPQPVQPTPQPAPIPSQPYEVVPTQPVPTGVEPLGNVPYTAQPTPQPAPIPSQPNYVQPATVQPAPVQQVPAQPIYAQPQPAPVQTVPVTPNGGINYAALNKRPVFVSIEQVNKTRTPFLRVKKDEYARIILFTHNTLKDHIHFIDGLGKIRCLSPYNELDYPESFAACCQFPTDDGKPNYAKRRQLMPVIQLPVSSQDGKTPVAGASAELKMWDMNLMEIQDLTQILKSYSPSADINDVDLTTFDILLHKDSKNTRFSVNSVTAVPTMRAPYIQQIQAELPKVTDEFWDIAWEESAKVVEEGVIINKLNEVLALQAQVNNQMQNPPQPPPLNQALGGYQV